MKHLSACLSIVFLALLVATVVPLAAQEKGLPYVVEKDDTLWQLAGQKLNDPLLWEKIYERNPFLRADGRRFVKNGQVIVLIKPGEILQGLEELGITETFVPASELGLEAPKPIVITKSPDWLPYLVAVLAVLLVAILMGYYLLRRMLTADPGTSGPAQVPGGVTDESASLHFQEMAARLHNEATSDGVSARSFTVLRLESGRMWGILNVRYSNGRSVPRHLSGQRAYRALVRFPGGDSETLYMLQACGNDLRYGGISQYLPGPQFRFEVDNDLTPAWRPAFVAEAEIVPAAAPPELAPATPVAEEVEEDGGITIELRPQTDDQGRMVRVKGVRVGSFTFTQKGTETTFRFREEEELEPATVS
ncbi:MAG: hypothetical protein A2722_01090 [Candidatus Doudnabacteria bacterium RIFCSPHIGHO2_01_FULL_50_11]|uniref:Uncharacterized protein n=1 Tax=Candidatus Doudnabacteria bacterium RIFCSPHIGHO2_01_FULL_50_11 TaxID=1817828 RepID=A0A1F5PF22_9BACT|nr:MAG: hypothetical protein A2722_01090 [Candidatus Doudnabacteria bacterium RIFCSPHIGHO2_01_FULL_50_11]HLC44409.1 hypothetical protein [Patescibacteria group bacterium]